MHIEFINDTDPKNIGDKSHKTSARAELSRSDSWSGLVQRKIATERLGRECFFSLYAFLFYGACV